MAIGSHRLTGFRELASDVLVWVMPASWDTRLPLVVRSRLSTLDHMVDPGDGYHGHIQ